jgi:hypothetical protein
MRRNPFKYASSCENWWRNMLSSISGYEPKTTFFSDLSIAECFGEKAILDTYNRVLKSYKNDIVYITEFVMCLNHKIWQLHEIDEEIALVYQTLWEKGANFVFDNFTGDDLQYYIRITD